MTIAETFGERLKTLAVERRLNAARLAKELQTTKASVSRYYNGERAPSLAMLVRAADHFGVTTDYLLGLENESSRTVFARRPPFAERFAFLQRRYGLTVYRLDKDTHINEDTVYGWQKGKSEPRAETLVRLAKYFGCTTDFVLGRV